MIDSDILSNHKQLEQVLRQIMDCMVRCVSSMNRSSSLSKFRGGLRSGCFLCESMEKMLETCRRQKTEPLRVASTVAAPGAPAQQPRHPCGRPAAAALRVRPDMAAQPGACEAPHPALQPWRRMEHGSCHRRRAGRPAVAEG